MIHFMDKNGRNICIDGSIYNQKPKDGKSDSSGCCHLHAEEIILELLQKLPPEEFLRAPNMITRPVQPSANQAD